MAVEKEIIVAVEFGSSKIRGVAGSKNVDGSIQVLAMEQVDARNCIRKGVVYNIDKTVMALKGIVEKMESALDLRITKVYVGIGGRSLRTVKNTESRIFATKTVISQEVVDALLRSNKTTCYEGYEILDVVPQEYRVGVDTTLDPVGVLANQIEATFLNVIAKTEMKEYALKCLQDCGLEVAGLFISPLTLGHVLLSDTERRSGCALVDFGYGTTTVSVYKNNLLRHLAVIPLGGNNITMDLCSLQLDEDEAEQLKVTYGAARSHLKGDDENKELLMPNNRTVPERNLLDIVEAREEEIIRNVEAQISYSGYQGNLLSGLVLTGGASNMKDIDQAVTSRIQLSKVRVVRTVPLTLHVDKDCTFLEKDGSLNTLLSLLAEGNQNCTMFRIKEEPVDVVPEVQAEEQELKFEEEPEDSAETDTPVEEPKQEEKVPKQGFGQWMKGWLEKLSDTVTE